MEWCNTSPIFIFTLISLAKALHSEHFKAAYYIMVSSLKVKFWWILKEHFHVLLLFLFIFPAYVEHWCLASHCSLFHHLLKRGIPMCPQNMLTLSAKGIFLKLCAARGACKKNKPAFPRHLIQFLNPSLQQVSGFRKMRIAVGWVSPLVIYHLYWCSGALHELQLVVPFVKGGHFCCVCSEHLKYQAEPWTLLAPVQYRSC